MVSILLVPKREDNKYVKQLYKDRWYNSLHEVYESDWYKDRYQKCLDSYRGKWCGVPEDMCNLKRVFEGNWCWVEVD